jgi:hypothetical protein
MSLLARDRCPNRAQALFLGVSVIVSAYYQCSGVRIKGDKCRAVHRPVDNLWISRARPRRLRFDTSFSHFGAEKHFTLALHFGTGAGEHSKKHSGRGDPPKSLAKKIEDLSYRFSFLFW